MVNEEQPSSMRVHTLGVDSFRCRRRAVLHGQKHAPDELLQADGERRPRVTRRVSRQLAGYEPNIFGEVREVVLDEMLGDEVAGAGNASTFCWQRARVYPTSSVNHVRLTPLRANSLSHQQGEVWLGRKLGQPTRTRSDSTAINQAGQSRPAMTLVHDPAETSGQEWPRPTTVQVSRRTTVAHQSTDDTDTNPGRRTFFSA